jgi:peptide deformylase
MMPAPQKPPPADRIPDYKVPDAVRLECRVEKPEVMPLRFWPDPILREPASAIDPEVTIEMLRVVAEDMATTMYQTGGVGLAAPQVGLPTPLLVCDVYAQADRKMPAHGQRSLLMALLEPRVLSESEAILRESESCLSFPGLFEPINRPERIIVRAKSIEGVEVDILAHSWLARVLCHEIDHLNGMSFLDRMGDLQRQYAKRRLQRFRSAVIRDAKPKKGSTKPKPKPRRKKAKGRKRR